MTQPSLSAPSLFRAAFVTLVLTSLALPLAAQDGPPPHGPPPREAIEACASHASGASCAFTSPRGEALRGTCYAPEGRPLACLPAGMHPPH